MMQTRDAMIRRGRGRFGQPLVRCLSLALGPFLLPLGSTPAGDEFDPKGASSETLLFHAQRWATTEQKKQRKQQAHDELMARGPDALAFLLAQMPAQNVAIALLAEELVHRLKPQESAPVLLEALQSRQVDTRRAAAYFLGFLDTPGYATKLVPLLDDEKTAGAAIRTLGKWKVRESTPRIVPFLKDAGERRRVQAANALRDIGDSRSVPFLMEALDDPVFTVRRTAARALATIGEPAVRPLLEALPDANSRRRGEILRILAAAPSEAAKAAFRRLREAPDAATREETARAVADPASRPTETACQGVRGHAYSGAKPEGKMIGLMLVDDHVMFRECLRDAFAGTGCMQVHAEAGTGKEMFRLLPDPRCNVILLDINLPDGSGSSLIPRLREHAPDAKVLVLSMHANVQHARHALQCGAAGYVTKDAPFAELVEAVRRVTRGETYVCTNMTPALMDCLRAPAPMTQADQLSTREFEVLTLMGQGCTLKETGHRIGISLKTVSTYRARLMSKLGLKNNADLVRYAIESGIVN